MIYFLKVALGHVRDRSEKEKNISICTDLCENSGFTERAVQVLKEHFGMYSFLKLFADGEKYIMVQNFKSPAKNE